GDDRTERADRLPSMYGGRWPPTRLICEQRPNDFESPLGPAESLLGRGVFGFDPGRYQPGPAGQVVEADDPVVHPDGEVRHLEFVAPRRRLPLERAAKVVAEQAGPAADERWQTGNVRPGDRYTVEAIIPENVHGR